MICGASDGYGGWCTRLNTVTNGAISVGGTGSGIIPTANPGIGIDNSGGGVFQPNGNGGLQVLPSRPAVIAADPQPFGIRRDVFWPRSLQAWTVLSVLLILASIQLVSPTRRWRLLRRPSRRTA